MADGRDRCLYSRYFESKSKENRVFIIAIATVDYNSSPSARKLNANRKNLKRSNRPKSNDSLKTTKTEKDKSRVLASSPIVPGRGWSLFDHPAGFCDGTAQSECARGPKVGCLLYEHNDSHGVILGDGLGGWLVMRLDGVREGIVTDRIETWRPKGLNKMTEGWTEENNGMTDDETPYVFPDEDMNEVDIDESESESEIDGESHGRKLGGPPPPLPDNALFEIAIDGEIKASWNSAQFEEQRHSVAYNFDMFVLLDDESMAERFKDKDKDVGETVEVAIRLSGVNRDVTFGVSHIYWARYRRFDLHHKLVEYLDNLSP